MGARPRIDVGHHIEDAMSFENPFASIDRDIVAFTDGEKGVNFEMNIDDKEVAHFAEP
jgi:hypothetical protein